MINTLIHKVYYWYWCRYTDLGHGCSAVCFFFFFFLWCCKFILPNKKQRYCWLVGWFILGWFCSFFFFLFFVTCFHCKSGTVHWSYLSSGVRRDPNPKNFITSFTSTMLTGVPAQQHFLWIINLSTLQTIVHWREQELKNLFYLGVMGFVMDLFLSFLSSSTEVWWWAR